MPFRTVMTQKAHCARFPFRPVVAATFALLLVLSAAPVLRAQCSASNGTEYTFTSSGGLSLTQVENTANEGAETTTPQTSNSAISVSGVSGTVGCAQVELEGVSSPASGPQPQGLYGTQVILEAPGSKSLVVLGGVGESSDYPTDLTMTIGDGYGAMPNFNVGTDIPLSGSYSYAPTSDLSPTDTGFWPYVLPINPPSAPALSLSGNYPAPDASQTMSSIFNGATANGTWNLYLTDFYGDPVSITGWKLNLWVIPAAPTSTSISASANPLTPSSTVTYTATVTSGSSPISGGTVTFYAASNSADNAYTPITCSGGNQTVSSGTATCTVTLSAASAAACTTFGSGNSTQDLPTFPSVCQGNQSIYAAYNGSTNYSTSQSSTLTQVIIPTPTQSGDTWCSSSPIAIPYSDTPGAAYPAIISIPSTAYSAGTTVSSVSVTLNDVESTTGYDGAFLLVAPGSGGQNLDFLDSPFPNSGCSGTTLTIDDEAGQYPGETCPSGSASYSPYDTESSATSFPTSSASSAVTAIPAVPATINFPPTYGSAANTFAAKFNGAPAIGDWALYATRGGDEQLLVNGGWCITLTPNTGVPTTTTVTSSQNPAPTGTSVTYTATVTSSGSPVTSGGTVTFLDNNTTPGGTVSGDNVVTLAAAGTATFSSSSLYDQVDTSTTSTGTPTETTLYEGDHSISAEYSGTESDNPSTGTLVERLNNPTTITSTGSNTYQACNAGPIYPGWGSIGPFTPNPSVIVPSKIPGTVNTVSLTLNNFYYVNDSGGESYPIANLESLLVGPTGAALDFFSDASSSESLTEGAYTFSDSGASVPSSETIAPGTYLPTSSNLSGSDSFVSSTSGFYNAPTLTASNYAQPKGSATFTSTFNSTNPNGNWSLFFNETGYLFGAGAANGWCLNFTENPVTVSATLAHSGAGTGGDFIQSETGASITVNVANSGSAGPTGDPTTGGTNPLTVIDTLNPALTYTGYTGSGWSCSTSSQTVTCTNDSSVAQSSSYPALTLNVNVLPNAAASISNSVSVSGAGTAPTSANDTIPVEASPVLAVTLTDGGGFKQGGMGQWFIAVSNTAASGATSGAVTVTDALPSGYTLLSYTSPGSLWTCSGTGTSSVTCTATPGIAAGASSIITLTVNIPITSPLLVPDTASAYGGGDPVHNSPTTAASGTDTVSVAAAQVATTLTISANPTSITYGQSVTLTATLSPYTNEGNGSNGENVTFYNGATSLGTGTLTNGIATLNTTALPVGTDSITAVYAGDTYLIASTTTTPATVVVSSVTITVTSIADSGAGSLRAALESAASNGGGNIVFDPTVFATPQTITLTSGTLNIPSNTTITGTTSGSGATLTNLVTIDGGGSANNFSIFTVSSGTTGAAISNLIIADGYVNTQGGGISTDGSLTVTSCTFKNNYAGGYITGGGNGGGAIYVGSGTLTISNSTFFANSSAPGGAIALGSGTAAISQSTFSGNSVSGPQAGGAIFLNTNTTVTIVGSTISGNSTPSGGYAVFSNGTLTATNTVIAGNSGGDCGANGSSTCPANGANGNIIGVSGISLAPLGSYGGAMQTMIPLPGSPAICAGLAANIPSGITTDQRGLPNKNTSYPGYNSTTPCVDAGAVQTNYAISFTQQPSNVAAKEAMSPAPAVTLDESGAPFSQAVTIPLTLTGSGSLSGGAVSTSAGVATYSGLSVSATGSGDTLTATLSLNPSLATPLSLTATSNSFNVTTGVTATQEISAAYLTENHAITAFTPVAGSGGTGTLTYSISPTLPTGLSFSTSTGAVSGTPTVASPATTYTVTVTDENNATASQTFILAVNGPLQATQAIASKSLTVNIAASPFTPVTATGGTGTLTYSISPTLPPALSLNPSTGAITGIPTVLSSATTYTVTVTDQNNTTATASFTLTVNGPLAATQAIASEALTYNTAANFTPVTGSGGTSPLSYTVAPSLPAGLSLNPSTGAITGTPAATQALTSYTVTVKDANGATATAGFSLAVNKATPTLSWSTPSAIPYGTALGAAQLDASASAPGSFTYTPAAGTVLAVGAHTLLASFTPTDTTDYNTPASVSVNLTVTAATLTVAANNATKAYGTANPSFTGSVSGAVNGNTFTESFTTGATASSPVGTYAIVPSVTGADLSDYTVATTNGTLSVTQAASSLALAASATSLTPGQSLTLTATATDATPNSTGTPTGTVVFLDGTTQIGTATLSNGVASMSISTLAAGVPHSLTATYAGDTNFTGSSASAPSVITVGTLDFTFTPPSNTSLTSTPGGTATTSFTIAPIYGSYQGQVVFSATGLPFGATATFSPSSLPASTSTSQTVTMTIQLVKPVGASQHASRSWQSGAPLALGLLVLPFATLRRLRKSLLGRLTLLIVLAAAGLAGAASLSGCGASSNFNPVPAQNYTVTVTAQAGSITHNFQFNLLVQ